MPRVFPRLHLTTFTSFRHRNYRLLWLATFCSSAGYWLQAVILGWLTYDRTQSPLMTTLVLTLDALPIFVIGPLGGLIIDAWDRRKLLAFSYAYMAAVVTGLGMLVILDRIETWHLLMFGGLSGLCWVISDPTKAALVPNIVPKETLVNAFALNSLAFNSTRLVVPMIGGALVALTGPGVAVFVEAGLMLAAFIAALFVRPPVSLRYQLRLRSVFSGLKEGVRYVVGEPVFLSLFIMAAIPSLFIYPFVTALMPVYAAEVFHVGPQGLGFLLSALGAGATVGTAVLASLGDVGGKGRLVLISMVGAGMACVAFSRLPWYGASLVSIVALGAAIMVVFATTSAIIQGITPDGYRGRVAGLYMMTWGILPLGSIVSGILAQRFGAPLATLFASIALFVAVIVVRMRFPRLSKVR